MSRKLSESQIVRELAEKVAKTITRKVIGELQAMKQSLLSEDSGLKSTWDEICVQVQFEQSFFWDAYDEQVLLLLEAHVSELAKFSSYEFWSTLSLCL